MNTLIHRLLTSAKFTKNDSKRLTVTVLVSNFCPMHCFVFIGWLEQLHSKLIVKHLFWKGVTFAGLEGNPPKQKFCINLGHGPSFGILTQTPIDPSIERCVAT